MPNTFADDQNKTPEERLVAIAELGSEAPEALNLREIRMLCQAHLAQTQPKGANINAIANDSKIAN